MEKLMKKIEAMDPEERKKLQKVLKEEKGSDSSEKAPMGWMYKESKPDNEEYLLGKRVDKHIEEENTVEADPNAPGASFQELIQRRADIDMQTKMREDPLYMIRQQEEDARRKLLSNPIKMKQLEKIIKDKEKKSKKKKKKKKHRRNSSSEDESSDDDLLNKYLEICKQKEMKAMKKSGMAPEEESSKHKKKSKKEKKSRDHSPEERTRERERKRERKRTSSHSNDEHETEHTKYGGKSFGLITRDGQPIKPRKRSRDRSHSRERSHKRRSRSPKKPSPSRKSRRSPPKKKLSADEMAQKRAEMLGNAKDRDVQRETNVKRYREESAREQDDHDKKGSAGTFLNPLLMEHAANTSVEDRIKRNKYNVQRTNRDLDKKFTQR